MKAAFLLTLLITAAFNAAATSPSEPNVPCAPDLLTLEDLLQTARNLVAQGKQDGQVSHALRTAANLALQQNGGVSAASIPPEVTSALQLAKQIDPITKKPLTQWAYLVDPVTPKIRPLQVEGAIGVGMKRIFVAGVKGGLLANGKRIPAKDLPGIKMFVVVDKTDERFQQTPNDLVWGHNSLDLIGTQKIFQRRRQTEMYAQLALFAPPEILVSERLLEFSWLSDHYRGFPNLPSSGRTIDFDLLAQGLLRSEDVISFIQYSLGSTGRERIVGSVRSGGRRFGR